MRAIWTGRHVFSRGAVALSLLTALVTATAPVAAAEDATAAATTSASTPGAPPLGSVQYPVPDDALFVSPSGNDSSGSGALDAPYQTLQRAASQARNGATIVLRGGTYREQTTWYGKRLTVQPYPGEAVWFSGSVPVTGWVKDGPRWRKDGWTATFEQGGIDPRLIADNPYAGYPDMVFIDGQPLRQVGHRDDVTSGTFAVDYATQRLYIGDDPDDKLVEGSVLSESIYVNHGHGSVIQGLGFRHFATHRSRIGAVKAFGDDVSVRDNHIVHNASAGLGVRGSGVVVESNTLAHNGQTGMTAWRSDGLQVRGNHMTGNNTEGFRSEYGGMKVSSAHEVVVADNLADANLGPGFWLDESIVGATVVRNTSRDNTHHGIFFEISTDAVIASNLVLRNGGNGIYVLGSDHVDVYNNTLVDNHRHINIIEDQRTIQNLEEYGHDGRFPRPQPGLTWDIHDVAVRNNILTGGSATTMASVDDVDKRRSGDDMTVSFDHNFYHRTTSDPRWLLGWSDWPRTMTAATSFKDLQQRTGQEANGRVGLETADPFFVDRSGDDLRLRADSPARGIGTALPARVASALATPRSTAQEAKQPSSDTDLGALHLAGSTPSPPESTPPAEDPPTPSPGPPAGSSPGDSVFPDIAGNAHHDAIVRMSRETVLEGFSDGTFRPLDRVTRGQMASMLARALDLDPEACRGDCPQPTDTAGSPHEDAIRATAAAGIALGYEDGTFRPGDSVTREQTASFLARAFDLDTSRDDHPFTDLSGSTHERAIAALLRAGVTRGTEATRFSPGAPVNRGQMASFLDRAMPG